MRRCPIALISLVLTLALCGCQRQHYPIQLRGDINEIVKITLVNEAVTPVEVLTVEDPNLVESVVLDIVALPCFKYINDPSTMVGYLHIDITYADGSVDLLGTDNLFHKSSTGDLGNSGWYYIDFNAMCNFFEKYTGELPVLPHS